MTSGSTNPQLTPRQKRFCEEYVVDLNGARACRTVGYKVTTDGSAAATATRLLKNVNIQAYVAELQAQKGKQTLVTAERIVNELAAIAFHNITDIVEMKDGITSVKNGSEWKSESKAAVQEVYGEKTQLDGDKGEGSLVAKRLKVKTYDKMRALELLAKINGLTSDFDGAIATLKNYGLVIKRDPETGMFTLEQ